MWQEDDEVTTTYGSIQRSLEEARQEERERIIAQLETEYWVWQDGTVDDDDPRNKHLRNVIARLKDAPK